MTNFKIGDRVFHRNMNDTGTVTAVGETIDIKFDHWKSVGQYDRSWFDKFPDGIQHIAAE